MATASVSASGSTSSTNGEYIIPVEQLKDVHQLIPMYQSQDSLDQVIRFSNKINDKVRQNRFGHHLFGLIMLNITQILDDTNILLKSLMI